MTEDAPPVSLGKLGRSLAGHGFFSDLARLAGILRAAVPAGLAATVVAALVDEFETVRAF